METLTTDTGLEIEVSASQVKAGIVYVNVDGEALPLSVQDVRWLIEALRKHVEG